MPSEGMGSQNLRGVTNALKSVGATAAEIGKDLVSPIALAGIAAGKFVSLMAGAAMNAEKLKRALAASDGAEKMRIQFQALGMSADQAKSKVEQIAKVASSSAFSFESLGMAARNLQAIGGASLVTAAMLKKVQDAAAASGVSVDNAATAMASMYRDAGNGGEGLGATAKQMANMGMISVDAADKVARFAAAGAPASDSMRVLEAELSKSKGASERLASTLSGLQSQLDNLQTNNDSKIGEMFAEGEKAGLRAAIGFEKVSGVVQEVATAPFAVIVSAINSIKEAIAGLLSSDKALASIKQLFTVLSALAVAVLGAGIAQMIAFIAAIGKSAVAMINWAKVAGLATQAGTKWVSWINTATGRMTLFAAGIALVAEKAWESVAAINASTKALEDLSNANAKQMGAVNKKIALVSTPEEKQEAIKDLDEQISANDEALKTASKERDDAKETADWWDGWDGGASDAILSNKENAVTQISSQGTMLRKRRDALVAKQGLGLTADQDKQERDRMILEDRIEREAVDRMVASSSPQAAKELANSELEKAKQKTIKTREDSKVTYKDEQALQQAQVEVGASRDKLDKFKETMGNLKGLNAESEVGKMSQDLSYRETLKYEYAQAQADAMEGKAGGQDRLNFLEGKIQEFGGGNLQAGLGMISGEKIDELRRNRDEAKRKSDPNAALEDENQKNIIAQKANEAAAADKASNEAGQRKLNIQKQLAALQGLEGGDGKAAEAELEPEIAQLKKKQEAIKALEEAEDAYNAARQSGDKGKIAEAEANFNQKRTAAFGEGMKEGDTVESVNQEVQATTNILNIRKQQAAIEQAAAQRRRDDLMNEMKMTNQILQLRLNEARGTTPGKTTQEIEREDRTRKRKDLESAEGVVAERDAAIKAGNSDLAMAKKKELEQLGVNGNATAQDVSLAIRKNKQEEIAAQIAEAGGRRQSGREARITSLSMQEEYAVTDKQRAQAKKDREKLEDEASAESKAKSFRDAGFKSKDAEKLAKNETEMERLASEIEREKSTRVDSLTSVGGGSGFVGLTPSQDKMERLRKLAEDQKNLLDRISKNNERALQIAEMELKKDK